MTKSSVSVGVVLAMAALSASVVLLSMAHGTAAEDGPLLALAGTDANRPSSRQVLPEVIWAAAPGTGTWTSEVQITDRTGGSRVSASFYYGDGLRRGPFLLWSGTVANKSANYANILQTMDALDTGSFAYYGRRGALELLTQDSLHMIQTTTRAWNGVSSKTSQGQNVVEDTTADTSRPMVIQNLTNNSSYRSEVCAFNPTGDPVTAEFKILSAGGSPLGTSVVRTFAALDWQSFDPFEQAGVGGSAVDNAILLVTPTEGAGTLVSCATSTNLVSGDPAAHAAAQLNGGYASSPSGFQALLEAIWAAAPGGGTWTNEVQVTDLSGGSQVTASFYYGGGRRRGPFRLWTGGAAGSSVKFANLLQAMDGLDPGSFANYGRKGAVVFLTQDPSHVILVNCRMRNANFSKTVQALSMDAANLANVSRSMMMQGLKQSSSLRAFVGLFNPTSDNITARIRIINASGVQKGATITLRLTGHDWQGFDPFPRAGLGTKPQDKLFLKVSVTAGVGHLMSYGNTTWTAVNDPSGHPAVGY